MNKQIKEFTDMVKMIDYLELYAKDDEVVLLNEKSTAAHFERKRWFTKYRSNKNE